MKLRRPCYIDGEEPLTSEEAEAILRSRGYDPDAVGKRMATVAQQALKIVELESQNAALLEALEKIKTLLGPDSEHGVARSDKKTMPIWEAIEVGSVFEFADEAIRKAKEQ